MKEIKIIKLNPALDKSTIIEFYGIRLKTPYLHSGNELNAYIMSKWAALKGYQFTISEKNRQILQEKIIVRSKHGFNYWLYLSFFNVILVFYVIYKKKSNTKINF